jgi:hypothetical protein
MKYWLFIILFTLASCKSPTKTIAENANTVQSTAQSSKERFEKIDEATKTMDIDVESIQTEAKEGVKEQTIIIDLTKSTLVALTKVEDEVPWWASLLTYIMITLSLLAIVFLLWYTGLGNLLKGIFYSLGLFIPKAKLEQADIARKALSQDDPVTAREMVAALRASDPAFDAAYKKSSKKEIKNDNSIS